MIKKIIATLLALFAAAAFAAVDANKATQAELEAVKGVGPAIATKILDERKKSSFKDWADLVERVKGVGEGNAAKFSAEGLTVNGAAFKGAPAAPAAAKKDDKKPAVTAAAAAPAPVAVKAAPAAVAASAAAPATAKADTAAADKAAAADAKKKAKEDKKAAKAAAAAAKASEAKK